MLKEVKEILEKKLRGEETRYSDGTIKIRLLSHHQVVLREHEDTHNRQWFECSVEVFIKNEDLAGRILKSSLDPDVLKTELPSPIKASEVVALALKKIKQFEQWQRKARERRLNIIIQEINRD